MINYSHVQKISSKFGVIDEIIEKDYFIELLLFYIAKNDYFSENFVFRGGTAIKKVYMPDYRFSEDLDFLIDIKTDTKPLPEKLEHVLTRINKDYPLELSKELEYKDNRWQFFVLYDIVPEIRAVKQLKIDVIKDMHIPEYRKGKLLFSYEDFNKDELYINTYSMESIISDKIGRILDVVKEPRDIYDLWYLLKKDIKVNKVKREFRNKYGYDVYIPNLLDEMETEVYSKNWTNRLQKQIVNLPDYKKVIGDLKHLIKQKLGD